MLTNKNVILERSHPAGLGGVQKVYRFPCGNGLSVVDAPMLHSYSFAWEVAVLEKVSKDGEEFKLTFDTELTGGVEVFQSDDEANEFIKKSEEYFKKKGKRNGA